MSVNDFDFIAKTAIAEKLMIERMAESLPTASEHTSKLTNNRRGSGRAFCPRCNSDVELLSFPAARLMFNAGQEDIERRTRSGCLHRLHNRSGNLMVCSRSLYERFA